MSTGASGRPLGVALAFASAVCWSVLASGCGYTARPGLPSHLRTVFVQPFKNKIDITDLTSDPGHLPLYRPGLESDLTRAVIDRFQFTGLLRPSNAQDADSRLEGELLEFRRDALRYDASQRVEEWRLSIVVALRFHDLRTNTLMWEEPRLVGDTTYFTVGPNAESESAALDRAVQDLGRRVVERAVESW